MELRVFFMALAVVMGCLKHEIHQVKILLRYLFVFVSMLACLSHAQALTLSGTVYGESESSPLACEKKLSEVNSRGDSGTPLPNVKVNLVPADGSTNRTNTVLAATSTVGQGRYGFGVSPGSYRLNLEHYGAAWGGVTVPEKLKLISAKMAKEKTVFVRHGFLAAGGGASINLLVRI
jgi:hypothetical protein